VKMAYAVYRLKDETGSQRLDGEGGRFSFESKEKQKTFFITP